MAVTSEDDDFIRHGELEEELTLLGGDDPDALRQIIWALCQNLGIDELEQVIKQVKSELPGAE